MGAAKHRGSIHASQPAAPALIIGSALLSQWTVSIELTNPSITKQGSANPVGAYAKLVLQKTGTIISDFQF